MAVEETSCGVNYYNDKDSFCCAWLRELIKAGLIPAGEVDGRSIVDVQPGDLAGFRQCHFFAGIGGWSYALKLAGWPEDREVWTGSCPCQPLSCAGQQRGHADERHLWPAFYRLIAECRPSAVLGEQVSSKDGREWLAGIRADLEGAGYAVGASDLCAASVGAPHRRQRLFWVADRMADAQCDEGRADKSRRRPEGRTSDGSDSPDLRLANPNGGQSGDAGLQRSGRHLQRKGDETGDGRVEESKPIGCGGGDNADPRSACSLQTSRRSAISGMGDPSSCGRSRSNGTGEQEQGPGAGCADGFWSDAIWIPTRDPRTGETKMRRISPKPSIFPLASRLPGRVGILRGAGNSIVPEAAAEFVKAFLEI